MVVYLSGGITGVKRHKEIFKAAEVELRKRGVSVINPAEICEKLPEQFSHDDYMDIDFKLLDKADAILMLPGWEVSKGACMEYGYAKAKGKAVFK